MHRTSVCVCVCTTFFMFVLLTHKCRNFFKPGKSVQMFTNLNTLLHGISSTMVHSIRNSINSLFNKEEGRLQLLNEKFKVLG